MPAGLHGIGQKDGTGGEWFRKHADRKTRIGGIGATSLPCLRLPFPVIPPNSRPMLAPILSYEDLGLIQGSGWLFQGLDLYIGERDCLRSEEHTSELQSLMRISYAVFCLKKK